MEPTKGETGQSNILGLVVFSVCFGIVIGRMGEKGKPLLDFCNCVTECTMKLFVVFIWYTRYVSNKPVKFFISVIIACIPEVICIGIMFLLHSGVGG